MSAHDSRYPHHIVALSGHGQALCLKIMDNLGIKHEEVFVVDASIVVSEFAVSAVSFFNQTLRPGEPRRTLLDVVFVPMESTGTHVFGRLPISTDRGELFRCINCQMTVVGRPVFDETLVLGSPSQGHAPYRLLPDFKQRQKFYSPCHCVARAPEHFNS